MRSGLVLIELMLVIVITGLLAALAAPRVTAWTDATAVHDEALQIVASIDAARGAAMRLGANSTLALSDTSYRVTVVLGSDTIVAWRAPGPARRGITLSGGGLPIGFGPAGLATGVSNRTLVISKGSALRTVVMSRLGRVTY